MQRLDEALAREERRERGRELAAELRELAARQEAQARGEGGERGGERPPAGAMRAFLERAAGGGGGGGGGAGVKETPSGTAPGVAGSGESGHEPDAERREGARWGTAHDPSMLDDKSAAPDPRAVRRAAEVEAMIGEGPSRAETIREASARGFATRAYRRAWQDYTAVSDEVMERDAVPPGYRWFVKRYFQLIRPRR